MRIKKYVAKTLAEAVVRVKAELGADAVILHIGEVKAGGLFGFFRKRMVQVMAAAEETVAGQPADKPAPAAVPRPPSPSPAPGPLAPAERSLEAVAARLTPEPPPRVGASILSVESVRNEMSEVKVMLNQIMDRVSLPADASLLEPALRDVLSSLLDKGVDDQLALWLLRRVRVELMRDQAPWEQASERARTIIEQDLSNVATVNEGNKVVALVGPTGVGKTTTLAKLSAYYAVQRRLRVALIAADTYRVAAVDQLRTYSEILGIPLEVAYEPYDVATAVERHRHRDLILVDTAGRSPRNEEHMGELQRYLEILKPDETYLVMSLTSGTREARGIVENYLPIGFDRFLFTKWDETESPGLIYNIVHKYRRPLSYVTTGQTVPDDIEVASPERIARAILGD